MLPAEVTDNNRDLLRCCNSRNVKRSYVVQSTCFHDLTITKINNLNTIVIVHFKIIVLDATVVCTLFEHDDCSIKRYLYELSSTNTTVLSPRIGLKSVK